MIPGHWAGLGFPILHSPSSHARLWLGCPALRGLTRHVQRPQPHAPPHICQAHGSVNLHAHTRTCLLWCVSALPPPQFHSWKAQPPLRLCWELSRDTGEGFLSFGFHVNWGVPLVSVLKRSSWIPRFHIRGCGHSDLAQKSRASWD